MMMRMMVSSVVMILAAGCGSSSSGGSAPATSGFAGVYNATFTGTYVISSPAGQPGGSDMDTATITVTQPSADEVDLSWQVPPNPPSGMADFTLTGDTGTVKATGGMCFTGKISNGDTQTNCCTACSITFSGNTFVQPNAGTFTGTTVAGDAYAGTYTGQWNGTKQ
jgi:hypothetical protein